MNKITNKIKSTVDDLARREEGKLECEYDFISERDMLTSEKGFISKVDNSIVIAYAVICGFFMIPDLIFMFFAPMSQMGGIAADVFFAKALVFVIGFLGVKFHNHWFAIGASAVALLNLLGGTDNDHTIGKVIVRKLLDVNFETNIVFFFAILIVSVVAVAAILKYNNVISHDNSTELSMREDKEAYNAYMRTMDERKKQLEADRKRALEEELPSFSDDLGRPQKEKVNYMDEI